MRIVKPIVTVEWATPRAILQIARIAKTAYKGKPCKSVAEAEDFVRGLLLRGHTGILDHATLSVRIRTDRGISHEHVRHRIAAYLQESTRYVNYTRRGHEYLLPTLHAELPESKRREAIRKIRDHLTSVEKLYNELVTECGLFPQEARSVLPTCTKTEYVATMDFTSWRNFLRLRDASPAHPDMRIIASKVRAIFERRWPVVLTGLERLES